MGEKGRVMGGLGEGGGVTLGDAGWGEGHQRTAAKLMPFFFSAQAQKSRAVADWQGRIQEVKMDLSIQRIICFSGGGGGGVTALT